MASVHGLARCLDTALRRASSAAMLDHVLPSCPRLSAGSSPWRLVLSLIWLMYCTYHTVGVAWPCKSLTKQREGDLWDDVASRRTLSPVVVQSLSHVELFGRPWTAACQAPLSSTVSQSLLKFMSIESVMLSNHLIHSALPPYKSLREIKTLPK